MILLGGEWLLDQEFFVRGNCSEEHGLLNRGALDEMIGLNAFRQCPVTTMKISISWAVSERMARLTPECRLSVEERILNLPRLELMKDGNTVACFPLVNRESDDDAEDDVFDIRDTNNETARSIYRVLQLIAFHELKESSILIELAWKSTIEGDRVRTDCRVPIPDPAKSLIIEYVGFGGFLTPAIEGA